MSNPWPRLAELPVRERILMATMMSLEEVGMAALTVRAIASRAGVNVAAINYYFGSKDRLLEEVRDRQLAAGFADPLADLDALLARPELSRDDAVRLFLGGFIRDMVPYPRTVEAYMHDALTRQDYGGPAFSALNAFLRGFHERTRDMLPDVDEQAQRLTVSQLWSAVLFMGLLPRATEPFVGEDLTAEDAIGRYVERLVAAYLPRA
jgi:AcrR family transcriptional regulator